ncbi:MAG: MFS transporter, partial [Alphaproteobacteria bacterium]|nr:MFS transporter [Alphaproteobacteria bacterium]
LGNILGAWPLAWASEAYGWRAALWAMAGITALVAAVLWHVIPDPPRAEAPSGTKARLRDVLRIRALWWMMPLLVVNYAAAAGLRGLWAGPYLTEIYGAAGSTVGQVTLVMALAMIAGNFAYGPLDRWLGTRKWVILGGNLLGAAALGIMAVAPGPGLWASAALLAAVGFFGASFPMLMAHGRSFVPAHLTGRGVTLINLFSIGGVGLLQMASGHVHRMGDGSYSLLFGFFAVLMLAGCAVYLFATDRTD